MNVRLKKTLKLGMAFFFSFFFYNLVRKVILGSVVLGNVSLQEMNVLQLFSEFAVDICRTQQESVKSRTRSQQQDNFPEHPGDGWHPAWSV